MIVHLVLGAPRYEPFVMTTYTEGDQVVGVDRGALYVLKSGYPLTVAIGDFDSVSSDERTAIIAQSEQHQIFKSEKDDTDTELALVFALNHYPDAAIHIHNWMGGRLDHFISIMWLVYQERFEAVVDQLVFYDDKNEMRIYRPGSYTIAPKTDTTYLSYIGLTAIQNLTLKKVKYTVESESYSSPRALISNAFLETGEPAYMSFDSGLLAVIQSID